MNSYLDASIRSFDAELESLISSAASPAGHSVAEHWRVLRAELLPRDEERRSDCPSCGKSGFASATRCGYCWAALVPTARASDTGSVSRTTL